MDILTVLVGVWAGSLLADFTVAAIVVLRAKRRQAVQLRRLAEFEAAITNGPATE